MESICKLAITAILLSLANATPLPADKPWDVPQENIVRLVKADNRNNDELAATYRLSTDTVPVHYDLSLHIDPNAQENFKGEVVITVRANTETNEIKFHGANLTFADEDVTVYSHEDPLDNEHGDSEPIVIINIDRSTSDDYFITITTEEHLKENQKYDVTIKYTGLYTSDMLGLYISSYRDEENNTRNLATTQFQPWHARKAFPCYDEPAFKATFTIQITVPEGFHALSNMNENDVSQEDSEEGSTVFKFNPTIEMSTYLIAFVVSDYVYRTAENDHGIPFKTYFRNGQNATVDFALDFGPDNLNAISEYVDFPYHFPKMDKVAIPDFNAGAMENWGLVTYREELLLFRNGVSTTRNRHNIATIISHENAHMWFGNEVSPQSWDYLWLNEGFATFLEYYGTHLVNSDWRLMDQFNVLYHQAVMLADSLPSSNPMSNPVYTPSQINGQFNSIAYSKAGSVIKMMSHVIGDENFKAGLNEYIEKHHRKTAVPDDLYAGLDSALSNKERLGGHSVATVFSSWAEQAGYPLVTVEKVGNRLLATQRRFYQDPELLTDEKWYIPLNLATSSNSDFMNTTATAWLRPLDYSTQVGVVTNEDIWYIVNKQETGYYRVQYDNDNWQALGEALRATNFSHIHPLNRAQIINDAMNLAGSGQLNYNIALEVVSYLENEIDYIPWVSANTGLVYLHRVMRNSEVFDKLEAYILKLIDAVYKDVGYEVDENEPMVTRYNRIIALNWACSLGREDCEDKAVEDFNKWKEDGDSIHPDIQGIVYCTALRKGDFEDFEKLWKTYVESDVASQRGIILNSIGCVNGAENKKMLLDYALQEDSGIRDQDRHTAFISVINSGSEGVRVALEYMTEHFEVMKQRITSWFGIPNTINAIGLRLIDDEEKELFEAFVTKHGADFDAFVSASIAGATANSELNLAWQNIHMQQVNGFLNAAGAHLPTGLFVGLFSLIVMILNRNMH